MAELNELAKALNELRISDAPAGGALSADAVRAIELADRVPRKRLEEQFKGMALPTLLHIAEKVQQEANTLFRTIAAQHPAVQPWAQVVRRQSGYANTWRDTPVRLDGSRAGKTFEERVTDMYFENKRLLRTFYYTAVGSEKELEEDTLKHLLQIWYSGMLGNDHQTVKHDWQRWLGTLMDEDTYDAQRLVNHYGVRLDRLKELMPWLDAREKHKGETDLVKRFDPATAASDDIVRPNLHDWALRDANDPLERFLPYQDLIMLEYQSLEWCKVVRALMRRFPTSEGAMDLIEGHVKRMEEPWYTLGVQMLLDKEEIREFLEEYDEVEMLEYEHADNNIGHETCRRMQEGELQRLREQREFIIDFERVGILGITNEWIADMLAAAYQLPDRDDAARLVDAILVSHLKMTTVHDLVVVSLIAKRLLFLGPTDKAKQLIMAFIDNTERVREFGSGVRQGGNPPPPRDVAYESEDEDGDPLPRPSRATRFQDVRAAIMQPYEP